MKKSDVLAMIGDNRAALARILGVSRQAVSKMPDELSSLQVYRLRALKPEWFNERGELKAKRQPRKEKK